LEPYHFLAALPAILAFAGFISNELLRRSGSGDEVTRRIVEKLRTAAPTAISPDQRLNSDQVERVLKGDQTLRGFVGEQDFLLLQQTLKQQFVISLAVYGLAAVLCALSIILFIRQESAKKQLALTDISLTDSSDLARGAVVDLDPLDIKWSSSGEAEDIDVYLENVQTSLRTVSVKCHSSENVVHFSPDTFKALLADRTMGHANRLRAVLQSKTESFSSKPVEVSVGLTVLTLLDQKAMLTVAAMIDNSRLPFYDFQAKIVVLGRTGNRAPLSIGPNIPYQFKSLKVTHPKELDWDNARGVYFFPDDPRSVRFEWLIEDTFR
jgi:hypothetical protein